MRAIIPHMVDSYPAIPTLINNRKNGDVPARTLWMPLSVDDKLIILWGLYREYSNKNISRMLPCGVDTVRRYKSSIYSDPLGVFDLPVYIQQGSKRFKCTFCSSQKPNKGTIIRHVLSHVVPMEIARDIDLRHTNGRVVL